MKFLKLLLIALIVLPAVMNVSAEESDIDDIDGEDTDEIEDLDDEASKPDTDEEDEEEMDDGAEEDEDEDIDASADAETTVLMVDSDENEYPAGKTATAVIGFHNIGSRAFFVKYIEGSFRFPQDFRYPMQNFSVIEVNTTVPAGEQASFLYKFQPHESFDPRDIGLVINVHYVDEDESFFRDAVFNDTVSITDADTTISTSTIVSYVVGLVALLAAYKFFTAEEKGYGPIERGTNSNDGDSEWLTELQSPTKK
eukprot:m.82542 g.82542  ORF g.82542 m.82542 type:complete len:254 (-) comp25526_c0_seq1:353-1114(-)